MVVSSASPQKRKHSTPHDGQEDQEDHRLSKEMKVMRKELLGDNSFTGQ